MELPVPTLRLKSDWLLSKCSRCWIVHYHIISFSFHFSLSFWKTRPTPLPKYQTKSKRCSLIVTLHSRFTILSPSFDSFWNLIRLTLRRLMIGCYHSPQLCCLFGRFRPESTDLRLRLYMCALWTRAMNKRDCLLGKVQRCDSFSKSVPSLNLWFCWSLGPKSRVY